MDPPARTPPPYPPHLKDSAPGVSLADLRASLEFEAAMRLQEARR
jgi:hypothetical protein